MTAYYNEIEPYAAQWLRNLIDAGHIAPGIVDTRSIEDVRPNDLIGFTQCHFFAGIGIWPLALRLAGWSDNRPVWTGSCPCQPFSSAGKGTGFDDERHLWPAWHHLITERNPDVIFGEQVASQDGLSWFDLVQTNLENAGYTSGAIDLCAAGFGSPNIRQRLFIVAQRLANANKIRFQGKCRGPGEEKQGTSEQCETCWLVDPKTTQWWRSGNSKNKRRGSKEVGGSDIIRCMADANNQRCDSGTQGPEQKERASTWIDNGVESLRMADNPGERCGKKGAQSVKRSENRTASNSAKNAAGPTNGFWKNADWLFCRDGKWRAVESGTFPLVNGNTSRVGRLRAYGNAINAQAAKTLIQSYMEL